MNVRRPSPLAILALLGVLLFTSLMITILVSMAIWPGEAKLTAPLFCDDARPDAYVVSDTYSYRPGEQTINFTLYCVGPRGDFEEIGWMAPTLALWAGHTAILLVVGVTGVALSARRRAARAPT